MGDGIPVHRGDVFYTINRIRKRKLTNVPLRCNEDLMESLFGYKAAKKQPKVERKKEPIAFEVPKYIQIINPRKEQNLSILLRALNVTTDEVYEAILEGDVGQLPVSRVMEETSDLMGVVDNMDKKCTMSECHPELFHHILVPTLGDPHGVWDHCEQNPATCSPNQINVLQGDINYSVHIATVHSSIWRAEVSELHS